MRVERGFAELDVDGAVTAVATGPADVLVGDWVAVDEGGELRVEPRRTVLTRQSAGRSSRQQDLAANVDVVVVVEPTSPAPSPGRIERLLVIAWSSGALPLVVLSKAELADDLAAAVRAAAAVAPGADVVAVSAVTGFGMPDLAQRLAPGETVVLIGPSGAGKSTLVNALVGDDVAATAEVRGDGRGRHTTTYRQLVPLPGGAVVIDTPGLRSVGVVGNEEAVDEVFAEIIALAEDCRFSDCAHQSEPGCAVIAAVADGTMPERRLESWHSLQREVAYQERRSDARLQREYRARARDRSRQQRRISRP